MACAEIALPRPAGGARTIAVAPVVAAPPPQPLFAASIFGAGSEFAPGRMLMWRCTDQRGCVLELSELSLVHDPRGAALAIVFPSPLMGAVAMGSDPEPTALRPTLLFLLTADGAAHTVALPSPASLQQLGASGEDSVLADGLPAVRSVDVTAALQRLDRRGPRCDQRSHTPKNKLK